MLFSAWSAFAQLDSTSAILLRKNSKPPADKNLDSSRYKVRVPESRKEDDLDEEPGTYIPATVPKTRRAPKTATESAPATATGTATAPVNGPQPAPPPQEQAPSPPVTTQVRELILGGSEEDIIEVQKQFHPEDPRNNLVMVSIAPGYYYSGSNSNYSYRNYSSHSPGLSLGMNMWLTPFFGLQSKYFTSVSSSVRDGSNMVPMNMQEFEAGLRFRKHFGYKRKSPQISWGLDYHDVK